MPRRHTSDSGDEPWMDDDELSASPPPSPPAGLAMRSLAGLLGGSRFAPLVRALRESGADMGARLAALQELSEVLSMSTEDALAALPTRAVVAELVVTLRGGPPAEVDDPELAAVLAATAAEDSGEVQLLACRCMAHLLEALPPAVHTVVREGAVPVLLDKLREITFIDLAEQVLAVLERIAPTYPNALVREDGLVALLQYVDFFNIHVQRSALTTFAHCCQRLAPQHARFVAPVAPLLRGVLGSSDARLVQAACRALCAIVAAFAPDPALLEELVLGPGLLAAATALVGGGPQLARATYMDLFRALGTAAGASTPTALALFDLGMLGTVHALLTGGTADVLSALAHVPEGLVLAALGAASALLPPLPTDGLFDEKGCTPRALVIARRRAQKAAAAGDPPPARAQTHAPRATAARLAALRASPAFWTQYMTQLVPVLLDVYDASVSPSVCTEALTALLKALAFAESAVLAAELRTLPLASFVAGILAASPADADVRAALLAAELLLDALPHVYRALFEREGVTYEVERRAAEPASDSDVVDAATANGVRACMLADRLHMPLPTDDPAAPALAAARHIRERLARVAAGLRGGDGDGDGALAELAALLTKERATSIELLHAGVVEALVDFVHRADGARAARAGALRTALRGDAAAALVHRLHEAINRLERFPLATTPTDDGTPAVAQHMRLQLKADRAAARELPASCRSMIVEVHAIAKLQALNDYLRPKLTLLSAGGGLSGMLAALAEGGMGDLIGDDSEGAFLEEAEPEDEAENEVEDDDGEDEAENEVEDDDGEGEDEDKDADDADEVEYDDDEPEAESEPEAEPEPEQEPEPEPESEAEEPSTAAEGPSAASPTPPVEASVEDDGPKRSYSSVVQQPSRDWHLEFRLGDEVLPLDATVFGAIYRRVCGRGQPSAPLWANVYTLTFAKVPGPPPKAAPRAAGPPEPLCAPDAPLAHVFALLRTLLDLGVDAEPLVTRAQLVNNRLTAKLGRQLDEALMLASGCVPSWTTELPRTHWFLCSFDTRLLLFRSTALGYARLLSRLREQDPADETLRALSRVPRQKVRIARDNILASAVKVMELYAADESVLEVEYFDEVGSGLGPTLEFYALVSREFARADLNMWRAADTSTDHGTTYVHTAHGLFPGALPAERAERKQVLTLFHAMGAFVAKSLLDSRIIDVRFSPHFLRAVRGEPIPLTLEALSQIDPTVAHSLASVAQLPASDVDALALDFTLPGAPHIELVEHGAERAVTADNRDEYVALVLETTLHTGVAAQIEAFRRGFDRVIALEHLAVLQPDELAAIFGHGTEDWSAETLRRAIVPDHGFSACSREVADLIEILSTFSADDRRTFLQWLTGSPRLPVGGFASLQPPLTVVRRQAESPLTPDDYLPSVMTCVNYLKLPCYSSRDTMRARLETAMREGLTTFHLS